MNIKWLAISATLALAAGACGGGDGDQGAGGTPTATVTQSTASPTGSPACAPSGTTLEIEAENVRFDKSCLAAPAATPFTLRLKNRDAAVQHSVAIYRDADGTDPMFQGERVLGPGERTYNVSAIPAGQYFFRCEVHPAQMRGQFVAS